MDAFSLEKLQEVASIRNIEYEMIDDPDPLVVRSKMSKSFPVAQEDMFEAFADPIAHVGLFPIITSCTPPIRKGLEGVIPENQFFAFEHVQESNLPPRVMLVRYTLEKPFRIVKEAITDPFDMSDLAADKKKGLVSFDFEQLGEEETKFTASSTFHAENGSVFARGFIDRVWLNFFERMMFANGQISDKEYLS